MAVSSSLYSFTRPRRRRSRPRTGTRARRDGTCMADAAWASIRLNPPPVPRHAAPRRTCSPTSATLNGSITPARHQRHDVVRVRRRLRLSTSSTTPQNFTAGTAAVPVSAPVAGLQPFLTYHFRLVASCALGVFYGPDMYLLDHAHSDLQRADRRARDRRWIHRHRNHAGARPRFRARARHRAHAGEQHRLSSRQRHIQRPARWRRHHAPLRRHAVSFPDQLLRRRRQ